MTLYEVHNRERFHSKHQGSENLPYHQRLSTMVFRLIWLGIPDDLFNGQRPDLQEDSGLPFCKSSAWNIFAT